MKTLLERMREELHDEWEKNSEYERAVERGAVDDFIDRKINEMPNVELLEALQKMISRRPTN